MDVKETGEEHVDWINLANNIDNRWNLVNIATILRGSVKRQCPEQLRGCRVVGRESTVVVNTFAASYLNTQGLNISCLKSPASTLVDLTFQSRALRSFSLNQLRNLSL